MMCYIDMLKVLLNKGIAWFLRVPRTGGRQSGVSERYSVNAAEPPDGDCPTRG